MSKKKILILILIILVVILASFLIYFLLIKKNDNTVSQLTGTKKSESYILYQKSRHAVSTQNMLGKECHNLNFSEFLDGGIIKPDGSDNKALSLKDNPTSLVTSKKYDNYFYISSPSNPTSEIHGYPFFNWSLSDQSLWSNSFKNDQAKDIQPPAQDRFPGGVISSSDNEYLVYLMTTKRETNINPTSGFVSDKLNPFVADSNMIIREIKTGEEKTVLSDNYNRQLFASMADFSDDGEAFYTITRDGENFKFIKVLLNSGKIKDFSEEFPGFDWDKIPWDEFFPKSGDYAYASFSIDPDEERLIICKSKMGTDLENYCVSTATHKLWVFNLEGDKVEIYDNQEGFVSDLTWKKDGQEFALAIMTAGGCYPDYMDARIDKIDKNGKNKENLVTEKKSKITHIGWSPDGKNIAYDTYNTDFVGRLKLVNVNDKKVKEIINTQTTEGTVDKQKPALLLFADWVLE
jgi:hypothetical protein